MPRPSKYPWEDWFGRDLITLRKGRDYVCRQSSMAQQIRSAASRFGVSVHVTETDKGFRIKVTRSSKDASPDKSADIKHAS